MKNISFITISLEKGSNVESQKENFNVERTSRCFKTESEKSLRKIVLEFGVDGKQIQSIAICKVKVLEDYYNNISGEIKWHRRTTGNELTNLLCYIHVVMNKGINLT